MDTPPDNTPNTVMISAGNVHLLRQEGSEIILQTEPGMSRAFAIPENHWIHGWAERAGVLYLLLCETDAATGEATGGGQLGCWPSPEYTYQTSAPNSELMESGNLTASYRPLHVYYGDTNGARPTGFISSLFNLALNAPSELELQDSYDGTLNIIINDRGRNPALLVNSGFAVLPPAEEAPDDYGRYQIIVREGTAQTNRYRPADFTSRLRLHPKGGSLAKAYITSVSDGGKLPGGEYRYYFTYADADDNETGIFAECGPAPVFNAATPADAHGARDGENTIQRVVMQLSQLDTTFGYVRVRYVRRSGEPSAVAQAYTLTQRLTITPGGTIDFSHTGYEEETGLNAEQLAATAGSVSTFVTMAQAGNRLLLAGITQNAVEDAPLLDFARSLQLGHEQVRLPGIPGVDDGAEASSNSGVAPGLYTPLALGSFTGNNSAVTPYTNPRIVWQQGGHLNPLNATYRRGYPSGEAVAFGVRFVLNDYSLSDTYPLTGGDNLAGTLRYDNLDPNGVFPAVFGPDAWSQTFGFGTYNRHGVYRFPDTALLAEPLLPAGSNAVNILAARVTLVGGLVPPEVRERAVGIQFMRAERVPNRLVQGYALPTLRSLVISSSNNVFDHHSPEIIDTLNGATGNLKVLPTVRGVIETVDKAYGQPSIERQGVLPFLFSKNTTLNGTTYSIHDPRRMALYAPDALLRPAVWLSRLNQQDIQVKSVGVVYCKRAVSYANTATALGPALGTSWSLYKTTHQTSLSGTMLNPGRSFWTLDKQFVVNDGRFGSAEKFLCGKHNSTNERYLVNMAWTPYVGLQLNSVDLDNSRTIINTNDTNNTGFELFSANATSAASEASAYLVNVYNGGGIRSLEALKQVYQPNSLTYVPITQRLSWDELLGQMDNSNHLLLYGGDTYVHPMYRRITRALTPGERLEDKFDAHVGQVLSLVCETEAHPATRSDEVASTGTSSNESFLPRLGAGQSQFDYYRGDTFFMQGESTRYNGGYVSENSGSPALVQGAPRVEGVPFRARQFLGRVWASAPGIDGSFSNGYRFLPPLGFRDYERSLGAIVRLVPAGDQQVLLIHEYGLEVLAINERVLTGQSAGGPVYAQGLDFLPPKGRILSRELGCQHPQGICVTPAGVYGADSVRGVIWFWAFGSGEPMHLSDSAISTLLGPVLEKYRAGTVRLGTRDVRLTYDSTRGDIIVSCYQRAADGAFVATTNAVYSEPKKQWMGEHDYYKAQALVDVPRRGLFSLPLAGQSMTMVGGYSLWQHRALPAAGPNAKRAGAYGTAHDCWVEYLVLGTGIDTTKILDNLVLLSEGRDPDQVTITTAEQLLPFVQALVGPTADIIRRNAQRREGHTWVTIKSARAEKRRGRWIRVRLTWLALPLENNATLATAKQDAGRLLKTSTIVRDSFT